MPVTRRWAYLDHAAVAPLSGPAADVLIGWTRDSADNGDTAWSAWNDQVEEVRTLAARLIGA